MKKCGMVMLALLILLLSKNLSAQEYGYQKLEKSFRVKEGKVLKILIDVDAAELRIGPSDFDRKGHVSIYYQERSFDGRMDFDENRARLRITLEARRLFKSRPRERGDAEVEVYLPRDVETELRTRVKAGTVDMDLPGLKLRDFALKTWAGEVTVDFSQPNKIEMDRFYVNAKIGDVTLYRLGNANFKDAEINGGIGELSIDFTGLDLKNKRARIDLDIGSTEITFPRQANLRMSIYKLLFLSVLDLPAELRKVGRYYYLGEPKQASGEFFLKISPGLGELSIDLE